MLHGYFEKLHDRISGCSICTANPPQKTLVGPTKIKHTERNIEENAGNDWDSVGFPAQTLWFARTATLRMPCCGT